MDAAPPDPTSTSHQRMDPPPLDQDGAAPASEAELSETVHVEFGHLIPGPPPIPQSPPNYAKTAAQALQQLVNSERHES